MARNLYRPFPNGKSGQTRSRAELARLGAALARPYVPPYSLSVLAFAHDVGCPLEERPDAQTCTCSPTLDLLIYDRPNKSPRSVRLMEDGVVR